MKHLLIPDTQIRPGVNTDHIEAAANYAVAKKPDTIVIIGDWWDLPSLNKYEPKGSKFFEGVRYKEDVEAGKEAMRRFLKPIREVTEQQKRNKKKVWEPRIVFTYGNHDQGRIERAIKEDPQKLEGIIGVSDLGVETEFGLESHPYLVPVVIDGIAYCHAFINPDSPVGSPLGGTIENKLRLVGHSFSMGHNQKRQYGIRYNGLGQEIHGLVAGAFYSHDESYQGPQGNRQHWRGIVLKNEVENGRYDACFVSLDFLMRRWY